MVIKTSPGELNLREVSISYSGIVAKDARAEVAALYVAVMANVTLDQHVALFSPRPGAIQRRHEERLARGMNDRLYFPTFAGTFVPLASPSACASFRAIRSRRSGAKWEILSLLKTGVENHERMM